MDVDVLVVGAGPAGLTLAAELGLAGVDALVVEQLPEPGPEYPYRAAADLGGVRPPDPGCIGLDRDRLA
jgi:flavin-dependent dehydrogenase